MSNEIGRRPLGTYSASASGVGLLGPDLGAGPLQTGGATPQPVPQQTRTVDKMVTTDVGAADLTTMVAFCNWLCGATNPGIGNECTHFPMAGQFETDALEVVSYVWGRKISASDALAGDVVQYINPCTVSLSLLSQKRNQDSLVFDRADDDAKHHTAVLGSKVVDGGFDCFEANLERDPVNPKADTMQVRPNKHYIEPFSLLVKQDYKDPGKKAQADKLVAAIPDAAAGTKGLWTIDYASYRKMFGISAAESTAFAIKAEAEGLPSDTSLFFRCTVTKGQILFYRLQKDVTRGGLTPDQRKVEKEAVQQRMKASGRPGNPTTSGGKYGGNDKTTRDQYFKWDWKR